MRGGRSAVLLLAWAFAACDGRPVSNSDGALLMDVASIPDQPMPKRDGSSAKQATIYKITDGTLPVGTTVKLHDVIVTAVDGYGQYTGDVFVQETKGGPGCAIKLYRPKRVDGGDISDLKPGAHIQAVGTIKYFVPPGGFNDKDHPNKKHIKELDQAQITRLGPGFPPAPVVVTAAELAADPTAEGYEFMLVRVKDLEVTAGVNAYGEITLGGTLLVDDDLYPPTNKVGQCLRVTGISLYFFRYKLHPRSAADIAQGFSCPP